MKKFLFLLSLLAISVSVFAQIKDPVQWNFTATKKADKVYEVTLTASLPRPWHIYSQTTPDGGPVPTNIVFKTNPLITPDGKIKEQGKLESIHDENFGVDVKFYSDRVAFVQTVKLKSAVKTNITGTVEYMVCNDEKCLPPKKLPFSIQLQ